MNKSIKKLFDKYWDSITQYKHDTYNKFYVQVGFEEGVNVVINEIEKYIADLPAKSEAELANQKMLLHKIKQLKEK